MVQLIRAHAVVSFYSRLLLLSVAVTLVAWAGEEELCTHAQFWLWCRLRNDSQTLALGQAVPVGVVLVIPVTKTFHF